MNNTVRHSHFVITVEGPEMPSSLEAALGNEQDFRAAIENGSLEIEPIPGGDPHRPLYRLAARENDRLLSLGSGPIDLANAAWREIRDGKFKKNIKDTKKPRIVAVGDSWFHYPFGSDLLEWFVDQYAVKTFAAAGDVLSRMVAVKEYRASVKEIKPHFFMLSGGGNDLLGTDEHGQRNIKTVIKPFALTNTDVLTTAGRATIRQVVGWFEEIRADLADLGFKGKMVVHGYDYASPPSKGPWLSEPLSDLGYQTDDAQLEVVRQLVDAFGKAISKWATDHDEVIFANCAGRNGRGGQWWFDEIHPTMKAYRHRLLPAFREPMDAALRPKRP